MRRLAVCCVLALALPGCSPAPSPIATGAWRAWLDSPGGELRFGLEISIGSDGLRAVLINGTERIPVPQAEIDGRWVKLGVPRYDSAIVARLSRDGTRLDGTWRKAPDTEKDSRLTFHAVVGDLGCASSESSRWVDGRWLVDFESNELPAVAILESREHGSVHGTFLTTTGDYRYLAGCTDGDHLTLSVFDGAHAFLFTARLRADDSLDGDFWSRDSWHESWTARRDETAELPDGFELTTWSAVDLADIVYPDLSGTPRSLADPAFAGKARIVEVLGSWCPNCNDSASFLAELDRTYGDRGLSILGLAFEISGEFERDAEQVRRFKQHHGLEFPILVAGLADKDEASRNFPLIDRVRSYPTTIFLHGDGRVRAVHQGFTGPATGDAYAALRRDYVSIVEELLLESER